MMSEFNRTSEALIKNLKILESELFNNWPDRLISHPSGIGFVFRSDQPITLTDCSCFNTTVHGGTRDA